MKRLEYDEFVKCVEVLAKNIKYKNFDAIIFAARGGAFLAQALAYILNIRAMYSINCMSYDGQKKLDNVTLLELPAFETAYKNFLFVDEIVDSGDTLKVVKAALQDVNVDIYSIALFQRTTAQTKADFFLYESDEWIEFFWEDFEKLAHANLT